MLNGLVLVYLEKQPTSTLYHTFVDGEMLAEAFKYAGLGLLLGLF